MADNLEAALEAIRLTQEYAQLPAIEGWTWFDFYRKHRPEDAERLRHEWEAQRAVNAPDSHALDQSRRVLLEAVVYRAGHQYLYETSPTFRATVTALVDTVPGLVAFLATEAAKRDRETATLLRLMETPPPRTEG